MTIAEKYRWPLDVGTSEAAQTSLSNGKKTRSAGPLQQGTFSEQLWLRPAAW
jgi:hypothetical protein